MQQAKMILTPTGGIPEELGSHAALRGQWSLTPATSSYYRRIFMDVPADEYERIEREIASDESPVGIDAKKTHIIILHKLMEIEKRLAALEEKVT